jgi:hypothetical protein
MAKDLWIKVDDAPGINAFRSDPQEQFIAVQMEEQQPFYRQRSNCQKHGAE